MSHALNHFHENRDPHVNPETSYVFVSIFILKLFFLYVQQIHFQRRFDLFTLI